MNDNKGITLTSVIVYVIVMLIVVVIVGTITSFFYSKSQDLETSAESLSQFNKFNTRFLAEVKKSENSIKSINKTQIVFTTETSFTFADDGIYENKVKICSGVKKCEFNTHNEEEKVIVSVYLEIGNDFARSIEYVMEYENFDTVGQYEENYK